MLTAVFIFCGVLAFLSIGGLSTILIGIASGKIRV